MPGNSHVPFGEGPTEKDQEWYLAGGLLHFHHLAKKGTQIFPLKSSFSELMTKGASTTGNPPHGRCSDRWMLASSRSAWVCCLLEGYLLGFCS